MRRLFLFRPEPGASRSAERARELGLDPVVAPLFRIVPLDWDLPDRAQFAGLLITSANAVRCAGPKLESLRGLPVHAVGQATAAAAREAGFVVATTGDNGVERLLSAVDKASRLLHLCGEHRRDPGPAPLEIASVAVYAAEALPPPPDLKQLAGEAGAVHSPRAAARLSELVDPPVRKRVRVAAISEAAARALGVGWDRIAIAASPNDASLLACAARLCDKPPSND